MKKEKIFNLIAKSITLIICTCLFYIGMLMAWFSSDYWFFLEPRKTNWINQFNDVRLEIFIPLMFICAIFTGVFPLAHWIASVVKQTSNIDDVAKKYKLTSGSEIDPKVIDWLKKNYKNII